MEISPKKTYMWPKKHVERSLKSLVVSEMQIKPQGHSTLRWL